MTLGSTQPLTEMSTRNISWGKGGRCLRLTTLPPSCAVVMKCGNLNFLEPSGPLQACNGTALPYTYNLQIWSQPRFLYSGCKRSCNCVSNSLGKWFSSKSYNFFCRLNTECRSQGPRSPRHGSAAARLLGLWVRIPAGAWMFVSSDCSVLSGRDLCVGLITHPEKSFECGVSELGHKSSIMRRSWPNRGCCAMVKKKFWML